MRREAAAILVSRSTADTGSSFCSLHLQANHCSAFHRLDHPPLLQPSLQSNLHELISTATPVLRLTRAASSSIASVMLPRRALTLAARSTRILARPQPQIPRAQFSVTRCRNADQEVDDPEMVHGLTATTARSQLTRSSRTITTSTLLESSDSTEIRMTTGMTSKNDATLVNQSMKTMKFWASLLSKIIPT